VSTHLRSPVLLAVIPVLDLVITSTAEYSSYFSPLWTLFGVISFDGHALFRCDGAPIDRRLQILVIALPALLGIPAAMFFRDVHPRLCPVIIYKIEKPFVLHL